MVALQLLGTMEFWATLYTDTSQKEKLSVVPVLATPGSESSHLVEDVPTSSLPDAAQVGPT